jgi:hypothetical protein
MYIYRTLTTNNDQEYQGTAPTIIGAIEAARQYIREAYPNGCGKYEILDKNNWTIDSDEKSIRTNFKYGD